MRIKNAGKTSNIKPKKAITRRLFVYIILVVLGISGLTMLSNTLLLRPLYYYSLKNTMTQAAKNVSEIDFTTDPEIWAEQLNALTAGQPYDIVVRSGADMFYSSSVEFGLRVKPEKSLEIRPSGETRQMIEDMPDVIKPAEPGKEGERIIIAKDIRSLERVREGVYYGRVSGKSGFEMMVYTMEQEDGISIMLTQPVEPINQSILQANILLAGCTLLVLGVSAVFVFKISKRFTKPITQIQSSVGSIAALDFGCKCDIRTGDELQSLGEDVNRLSGKLKSALDTLRLQNEQLEKDIAAQRQFISNASHELRTPLALIKGYAEEISAGFADGQRNMYIGIITEEAAKMNRLLKEMLELTRMESGMARLQNEKLSVNESIQTFIEKYDGFISSNGLNVSLRFGEDAEGFFDPVRFEQVLANYISNAARYGDREKQVEISTDLQGDSIRISVFNTGKPIPEDIRDNIWDGFYKADAARTREEDSYGLGLSVVKAIQNAAQQGYGVYNFESGVVFWFEVARYQG